MDLGNFEFGNPKVNKVSSHCCGKPVGCTIIDARCVYLHHPWKRKYVFDETSEQQQSNPSEGK